MPPQPTPGKAYIQTKRLLLAKAKAMLQRPQQSLFTAGVFNTTTIQKRSTAWCREELQQLSEPDLQSALQSIPQHGSSGLAALSETSSIPHCWKASQRQHTRIHNLFDSSKPRLCGVQFPLSGSRSDRRASTSGPYLCQHFYHCCVSSASQQGWMMPR